MDGKLVDWKQKVARAETTIAEIRMRIVYIGLGGSHHRGQGGFQLEGRARVGDWLIKQFGQLTAVGLSGEKPVDRPLTPC